MSVRFPRVTPAFPDRRSPPAGFVLQRNAARILIEAVDRLSPAKMREFERRMAARRADPGNDRSDDATLVQAARVRLTAAAERRLRSLIARSERGTLTSNELAQYQALAQKVQRLNAARAEALAELARRRRKSVRAVKAEIGCEGGTDGT